MRKEAITSILAIIVFTVLCGVIYPLAVTGVSQVAFKNAADGSQIKSNGKVVGSKLIAQSFKGHDEYFQPRPSQTDYNPSGTFFNNAGPNNEDTSDLILGNAKAYIAREGKYDAALTIKNMPVDAATGSASGVDPHISKRNAGIQSHRIAAVRKLRMATVTKLIDDNTDGRSLGVFGEPGVNILKLNIALEKESSR